MLSYLILHFAAVLFYTWPDKNTGSKAYNYSFAYVYPYFHQNWSLFVPSPRQNFCLYVKYTTKNIRSGWKDLFYELNSLHQKNRLAGNESIILAFTNSLRYYASSVEEKNEIVRTDPGNINFTILRKVIISYLTHIEKAGIEHLQIVIGIKSEQNNITCYHYYKTE